jgi:GNAT superfamily N-acetyltransferase
MFTPLGLPRAKPADYTRIPGAGRNGPGVVNRTQAIGTDSRATAAIRPVRPADLPALSGFFENLSVESRYLRFFAPVRPAGSLLRLLSGGPANVDAVVAVADGVIVGHAMAADRTEAEASEDPCGARVTDIGVVVSDAWQRQGVGAALMRAVVTRAQARGVTSLAMDVLPGNGRVLAMIIGHWPEAVIRHSPDGVDIRVPLPRFQLPQPQGPDAQAAGGAARTHAGERCADAAVHTVSWAPDLSEPRRSLMTTTSAGLAAMPCLEPAAAWPAEGTAPGDLGCGGAPEPASRRC